jgi:hypothetical protein
VNVSLDPTFSGRKDAKNAKSMTDQLSCSAVVATCSPMGL